jgi:hypothetical protein
VHLSFSSIQPVEAVDNLNKKSSEKERFPQEFTDLHVGVTAMRAWGPRLERSRRIFPIFPRTSGLEGLWKAGRPTLLRPISGDMTFGRGPSRQPPGIQCVGSHCFSN